MNNDTFIPPVVRQPRGGLPNISGKIILIVIGLALALIVGVGLMLLSSANNPTDRLDQLNGRMTALQAVVEVGKNRAQDTNLKKAVGDASILLISDVRLIAEATATAGATGSNKQIIAAEDETKLIERLETAAVNGQFDQVYVPELIDKYESTIRLLAAVQSSTNSASLKSATSVTKKHCESIVSQLQALTI